MRSLQTHQDLCIGPQHIRNLAKLAVGVRDFPWLTREVTYDMRCYCRDESELVRATLLGISELALEPARVGPASTQVHACLLGHGPLVGLRGRVGEDWSEYEYRVFGTCGGARAKLLFGYRHHLYGPTRVDGVRRIAWLLEHDLHGVDGLSESWETPASFEPAWDLIEQLAAS